MPQSNSLKQSKLKKPPAELMKEFSSDQEDAVFQRWDKLFSGDLTAVKEMRQKTELCTGSVKQCYVSNNGCEDSRTSQHKIKDQCIIVTDVEDDDGDAKIVGEEKCVTVADEDDIIEATSCDSVVSRIYMHGQKPLRFEMKRNEHFKRIFLEAADQFHILLNDVCFFHNVQFIDFQCTPQDLNLPDYFILEARKVGTPEAPVIENIDGLELYFQTDALRSNKTKLIVDKTEKFSSIKAKLNKLLNRKDSSQITLVFDGTPIDDRCTPTDVDLEPGDCIDVSLP